MIGKKRGKKMNPSLALGRASRAPVVILTVVIASALVAALALSTLGGPPHTTIPAATVTIVGKASIVLCPEPAVVNSSACKAPPEMYAMRQIVLTSSTGTVVSLPLNPDGTFVGQLPPGSYHVAISNCNFLGCNLPMPATISVATNSTSSYSVCFNCLP